MIRRTVFAEVPPRVEYATTELGQTLPPVLAVLCDWGRRHAGASQSALDECDRDPATSPPVEGARSLLAVLDDLAAIQANRSTSAQLR